MEDNKAKNDCVTKVSSSFFFFFFLNDICASAKQILQVGVGGERVSFLWSLFSFRLGMKNHDQSA